MHPSSTWVNNPSGYDVTERLGVMCRTITEFSEVWLKVFSEVQTVMLTSMQRPSSITWLVAPGLAMIAITYGLARFAYGLFLPEMRESLDLSESILGLIGAGSYVGYCFAVFGALMFTSRAGPRFMAVAAGVVAVVGMATVAGAPTARGTGRRQ
jgi:hypothetical protein